MDHPDLLEGHAQFSDAGVFRLRSDLALVQTVDFFPPIVDDPRDFGRIAAANALSDCYAMGGRPITVLNVAGFPSKKLPISVLGQILAGGAEKVLEAGAVVVGGHTVEDAEVKFGLAVTGVIDPARLVSNAGARPGQTLVLTKPLGMGVVSTALKRGALADAEARSAIEIMATLNRDASEIMLALEATGATDITGFGFFGHAFEFAESSRVTLHIEAGRLPILPVALRLAREGGISGASKRNRAYAGVQTRSAPDMDPALEGLLFDSETSGGLLVALPADRADEMVRRLRERGHAETAIIGEVRTRGSHAVEVC
jgi:selenide,water dikinase